MESSSNASREDVGEGLLLANATVDERAQIEDASFRSHRHVRARVTRRAHLCVQSAVTAQLSRADVVARECGVTVDACNARERQVVTS